MSSLVYEQLICFLKTSSVSEFVLESSHELETPTEDKNVVDCIDYVNEIIVAGLRSGILVKWCTITKQCHAKLLGHSGSIYCVKISDNLVFSGGKDREIKIWDLVN